jgi:CBS domain containing-hemolysin-like protein
MEGLPSDATGWIWWVVSVVAVGILINLFSSFLYPRIEKAIAKLSESRRQKLDAQEREFQEQVKNLVANPDQIINLKIDLILSHLRAVLYVALGLIAINLLPVVTEFVFRIYYAFIASFFAVAVATLSPVFLIMDKIRKMNRLIRAAEKSSRP